MDKEQNNNNAQPPAKPSAPKPDKKKQQREIEAFKRKYFDYYDDIKISVKEDW